MSAAPSAATAAPSAATAAPSAATAAPAADAFDALAAPALEAFKKAFSSEQPGQFVDALYDALAICPPDVLVFIAKLPDRRRVAEILSDLGVPNEILQALAKAVLSRPLTDETVIVLRIVLLAFVLKEQQTSPPEKKDAYKYFLDQILTSLGVTPAPSSGTTSAASSGTTSAASSGQKKEKNPNAFIQPNEFFLKCLPSPPEINNPADEIERAKKMYPACQTFIGSLLKISLPVLQVLVIYILASDLEILKKLVNPLAHWLQFKATFPGDCDKFTEEERATAIDHFFRTTLILKDDCPYYNRLKIMINVMDKANFGVAICKMLKTQLAGYKPSKPE